MGELELLTTREVAAMLRVCPRTVERLRARKGLPWLRVGRGVRYVGADVAAWVAARREATPPVEAGPRLPRGGRGTRRGGTGAARGGGEFTRAWFDGLDSAAGQG